MSTLLEAPTSDERRTESLPATRPRRSARARARTARDVIGAYVALTKPRVIELLLVATFPAMFLAEGGFPNVWVVVATLVGGALAAGSANALNCYVDRDIDEVMTRTARRPLPRHTVSPSSALVFGGVLGLGSAALLLLATNWLAAALAVVAIGFYVVVYTMILKRRTPQNIVWGGAAGCMPVLIGWAAVTGSLAWPAAVLFAIIFFWTPPHYWPLAIKFRDDYARAGVPMLPVVAPLAKVANQIIAYSWVMVAVSLLLVPATSWWYAGAAAVLGGWFLYEAYAMRSRLRAGVKLKPMRLFHASITYLSVLFAVVALDALL